MTNAISPKTRNTGHLRQVSHELICSRSGTRADSALNRSRPYQATRHRCQTPGVPVLRCLAPIPFQLRVIERGDRGVAFLRLDALQRDDVGPGGGIEGLDVRPVDLDQVPGRITDVQLHPAQWVAAERRAEGARVEQAALLRL